MQLSHKGGVLLLSMKHTWPLVFIGGVGICCLLTNNDPGVELTQKFASNSNSYIITLEILEWKAPKT